jgi:hypothetical protein
MLDLEWYDLILEMFQHFVKTISLKHQDNIFSSMGTIMSLIIGESVEISKELVSCLFQSVRKDKMESSVSFKLGEKVIHNCVENLKLLLVELVGNKTNEYSKFVVSLCQEKTDVDGAEAGGSQRAHGTSDKRYSDTLLPGKRSNWKL